MVESLSKTKGDQEPIFAKGTRPGEFYIVDTMRGAPTLGELSFRERVRPDAYNYLEMVYRADCPLVLLIKMDNCGNLDSRTSFQSWWVVRTSKSNNNIEIENVQTGFDAATAMVEMSGTFNTLTFERVLPVKFGAYADTELVAEAIDTIFFDEISCGACAPTSSGCEKVAFLTKANAGSPGLSGQFVYRLKTGGDWATKDLSNLGGLSPRRMAAVDQYIVVISEADASIAYFSKTNIATSTVNQITTGLESGGEPRAIVATSGGTVFIAGAGGYIYKSENITTGVEVVHDGSLTTQDANDIEYNGRTIVSVHDSATILYSQNDGVTFALIDNVPENGVNYTAVWVKSAYAWYVGTSSGKLWFTEDGGETWTQRTLPNQSNLTAINDIKFDTDLGEIGALAVETSGAGYVLRTISGGREWFDSSPYVSNLPSNRRINAVALCGVNGIAAAGLKSVGTDGLAALAF